MLQIDNHSYVANINNYYQLPTIKNQILITIGNRGGSNYLVRLLHKNLGKVKKWNTYTITRDGIIYNHYDDKYYSDYIGIKDVDKQVVSIVLENMGGLIKNDDMKFVNWVNDVCDDKNVITKKWINCNYWEKFSDKQIESLVELCNLICDKHLIPKTCIEFNHYNPDVIKFKGILFKGNYVLGIDDSCPQFNINRFNELLSEL